MSRQKPTLKDCEFFQVQVVARNVFQFVIHFFVDHSFVVGKLVENLQVDNVKHKEKFKVCRNYR